MHLSLLTLCQEKVTLEDLKDARDIVMRAILKLEHIPVGMEMFAANGKDQWEIIKRTGMPGRKNKSFCVRFCSLRASIMA